MNFVRVFHDSLESWDELDQCVIDTSVRQWYERLYVCVEAKCRQFEYKLSNNNNHHIFV